MPDVLPANCLEIKKKNLKNFQSGRSAYIRGNPTNSTIATNKQNPLENVKVRTMSPPPPPPQTPAKYASEVKSFGDFIRQEMLGDVMFSLNVIRVFSKKKGKPQFSLKIQIKQSNKLKVGDSNYLISLPRSSEKKKRISGGTAALANMRTCVMNFVSFNTNIYFITQTSKCIFLKTSKSLQKYKTNPNTLSEIAKKIPRQEMLSLYVLSQILSFEHVPMASCLSWEKPYVYAMFYKDR